MASVARIPALLIDRLMPPHPRDHEAARGSRLVVRVALITLCVSSLMLVVYFLENARLIALITGVSITLQILGLTLHRVTGSYRVGGHMHCLAMWALFFGISALSGGIESPNIVANMFVVVLAPMLLGRRHGLLWLGVVGLTYVAQFQLASRGIAIQTIAAADIPSTRLTELMVTSITTGLTAYVFANGEERMRGEIAREKQLIEVANGDLRVILDNAGQGFLSLDARGRLIGERSAIIDSWLKGAQNGQPFVELLRPLDEALAEKFEVGWSQIEEGVLPLELCLDQMPKLLRVGDSTLSLECRAVLARGETIEKFVVIISDISAEVARAEAEVRQRDLLEGFERILHDPDGFSVFLRSAERDVRQVTAGTLTGDELKRCLHTLKGNAGVMGLSALARACHEIEDELTGQAHPSAGALKVLERELETVARRLGPFLASTANEVAVRTDEYEEFLRAVAARKAHHELSRMARSWSQARVDRHLSRLAEHAQQLSRRLDKGDVDVRVHCGNLRMPEGFADFWEVAVHVVRNAVDHGIERPEERERSGKGRPVLDFRTSVVDDHCIVEVTDDGRGIDWDRIRELARSRGLPAQSSQDLLAALLSDGLSTSESVTEISGRGVGMGSVRKVCGNLGIGIEARSNRGKGTTFRFLFPEQPLDAQARVAASSA